MTLSPHDFFFIVGCQRCGTTLLRLVLECHSRVRCWDESIAYAVLAGVRSADVVEPALVGMKIPCLTEQLANRTLWDALVLPEVPNAYSGQRILFMIRDVRDAIASMRALRLRGRPWIETRLLPSLRAKIRRDAAFRRRYGAELAALRGARHPVLARAAFYWRYKTDALFDYLDRGFPVLAIRYEDVAHRAETELRRMCRFLGLEWEPGLLQHPRFGHGELMDDGLAVGGTDVRRAIDTCSVERWRGAFSTDELDEILEFAGRSQARIYPELCESL
jgi:hypothetical protein